MFLSWAIPGEPITRRPGGPGSPIRSLPLKPTYIFRNSLKLCLSVKLMFFIDLLLRL